MVIILDMSNALIIGADIGQRRRDKMIIDYTVAKECKEITYGICYQCGKCGRKFNEYGIMIDDGGTTVEEEEE